MLDYENNTNIQLLYYYILNKIYMAFPNHIKKQSPKYFMFSAYTIEPFYIKIINSMK